MLSEQQVEKYKRILEEERRKLVEGVEDSETAPKFGDAGGDSDGEADEAEELENKLSIGDTMREHLNTIDEALEKVENGTYGICEECGKEIGEKVLQAAPESILCAECKKGHI